MNFDCELVGKIGKIDYYKRQNEYLEHSHFNDAECIDNDETASRLSVLLKSKYLLILTSSEGLLKDAHNPSSLIPAVEGKDTEDLLSHMQELFGHCDRASRKGANGMLAKLQYIQEPLKNGTTVIIGSPKYSIPDLVNGTVNRTIFRVR